MNSVNFIFIGKYADFVIAKKHLETKSRFKAIHLIDESLPSLEEEDSALLKTIDEIISSNCFDKETLVVASSLYSNKDAIFCAIEKGSAILLLEYKDINIDDYSKLEEYSKKSIITFSVPMFAHSKSILLKKMIGVHTKDKHITMSINDIEYGIFESDLFLLSLNLINKENIDSLEIRKENDSVSIITSEHEIIFKNVHEKYSSINMITDDEVWQFEWNILGNLNIYHDNNVKENYAHANENSIEHVYKNIYLNCMGSTQIIYTAVSDILLYNKIKAAFNSMAENSSMSISLLN